MSETELQATIKRLESEKQMQGFQLQQIKQQAMGVGQTFASIVRELLLAIADPTDTDGVERAKRHAKELLKSWDLMNEPPTPPPAPPNGASTPS